MRQFFELGRILKPQGIRGEVKAELYTDDMDRVSSLPYVLTEDSDGMHRHKVVKGRTDGRFAYLTLENVSDRNDAEKLRDVLLYIDRDHAAPIPEGAFYISDLIGLEVLTDDGRKLGILKEILQNGAKDVYVVCRDGSPDILFPAADGVFVERNPAEGRIIVSAARLMEVSEI